MRSNMYSGSDWLKKDLKVDEMSEIGEAVGNLLGELYQGIYHIPKKALKRVDWSDPHFIRVILYGELATFDGCRLTHLVLMCHDRMIRCSVSGKGPNYLELYFHPRKARVGSMSERHPTIEDHIKILRKATDAESH